ACACRYRVYRSSKPALSRQMVRHGRCDFFLKLGIVFKFKLAQNLAEVIAHLRDLLIAVAWSFGHRAIKSLLQTRRNWCRARLGQASRRLVHHGVANIEDRLAIEWPPSDEHFVEQNTGREDVRARVSRQPLSLLGCCVSRRAIGRSYFCEMFRFV